MEWTGNALIPSRQWHCRRECHPPDRRKYTPNIKLLFLQNTHTKNASISNSQIACFFRIAQSSQQTKFLRDAAERLKRMTLALDHAHAGRAEDTFFGDLSSYTQRIVCELNTALALLGVDPPQFAFESPLPQDSNAKLLFQFRLLRELRAQLLYVQQGVAAVRGSGAGANALAGNNEVDETVNI